MLSLKEQIDELRKLGYGADTAQAKVVHDVVLLAMHRSGFKSNSTVKGGVVMSSLTGDVRRATMDMDIDFIRYSLGKSAVARFVRKLARAIPECELKFEMATGSESAELQANSPEQMFAEKLLSLLRHGVNSNRPKDIFDMYYLKERVAVRKLKKYVSDLIYANSRCRVNDHVALMRSVRLIFGMRTFLAKLRNTRVNWLGISPTDALKGLGAFLEKLA